MIYTHVPYAPLMPSGRPTRRRELAHWRQGARTIVGVDEVGRGPLAGPLVTAAVSLPLDRRPPWVSELRDSKQLSARQRERLAVLIAEGSLSSGLGWVHAAELDRIGLSEGFASGCASRSRPTADRSRCRACRCRDDLRLPIRTEMIVKGDATVASIAAASIVAKVARDAWDGRARRALPRYGSLVIRDTAPRHTFAH